MQVLDFHQGVVVTVLRGLAGFEVNDTDGGPVTLKIRLYELVFETIKNTVVVLS